MNKPLAERPLPERTVFLGVIVGMAKDAGYKRPEDLMADIEVAWPHVKPPTGDTTP